MTAIWGVIKKAFKWISNNLKLFLLILSIVLLSVFIFWWGRKNSKIRDLENKLAVLTAQLKLNQLEVKYNTDKESLVKLKADDKQLDTELTKIEKSLEEKLKPDMTADEIIAKFKEIGIR
jgi:nitrogen fixation-related uncharacterized protein